MSVTLFNKCSFFFFLKASWHADGVGLVDVTVSHSSGWNWKFIKVHTSSVSFTYLLTLESTAAFYLILLLFVLLGVILVLH